MNKVIAWIDVEWENDIMYLSFYNEDGYKVHDDIIINDITKKEARQTQENIRYGMESSDFYWYRG